MFDFVTDNYKTILKNTTAWQCQRIVTLDIDNERDKDNVARQLKTIKIRLLGVKIDKYYVLEV